MAAEKQTEELENEEPDAQEKPEKPEVKADDDGNVAVSLPDDEKPRGTRRDRRAARQDNDEVRRLREGNESLTRQLNELHTAVTARLAAPAPGQQQQGDPAQAALDDIRERQEMIQSAVRTAADPAAVERYRKQFYDLDRQRDKILLDHATQRAVQQIQSQQAPQAGNHEAAILRSEFPEVVGNQSAFQYAQGTYQQLVAEAQRDGKMVTLATAREAMTKAAERFGLRQAAMPASSQAQQQRFGSVSAQAGGRSSPHQITLNRDQQRMAVQAFPDLDEHAAFAKLSELLRKQARESEGA